MHANSKIRHIISKCFWCRHGRGKFGFQKMSQLPKDRSENAPPFTYCCVDMFGPFIVKEGRKVMKRYGALFSDLVYRGIHIETTPSLETDTFINAIRRFIDRRGPIRLLRCDNGTNFVGTDNEFRKAMNDMGSEKIKSFLLENQCDIEWKYNTPASSHHGGVWERLIRSVRQTLYVLLKKQPGQQLNDDSLRTLMTEVESIVNSRPLTVDALSDGTSPAPLSPMTLLTQKSKVVYLPFGNFDDDCALHSKRQWRRVQYFANQFWSRFRKEYLCQIQTRTKWLKKQRNFEIGDVVLLKDDSVCRSDWPMARVVDVYPDSNGFVRSVKLKMARKNLNETPKFFQRPIVRIVLLVEASKNN